MVPWKGQKGTGRKPYDSRPVRKQRLDDRPALFLLSTPFLGAGLARLRFLSKFLDCRLAARVLDASSASFAVPGRTHRFIAARACVNGGSQEKAHYGNTKGLQQSLHLLSFPCYLLTKSAPIMH